jgi:hypothetical protein
MTLHGAVGYIDFTLALSSTTTYNADRMDCHIKTITVAIQRHRIEASLPSIYIAIEPACQDPRISMYLYYPTLT